MIAISDLKIALLLQLSRVCRLACSHRTYQYTFFNPTKVKITGKLLTLSTFGLALNILGCAIEQSAPDATEIALKQQAPREATSPQSIPKNQHHPELNKLSLSHPPSLRQLAENAESKSPDQAEEQLAEFGHHWFYGQGIGESLANVGTVVAFPPYAIYLLGNAGLALAGYPQLHVTDALPETPKKYVLGVYDGITSVPGRITSSVAGEEFESGLAATNESQANSVPGGK